MSSTRPAECLVCTKTHTDEMDFVKCEASEFFDILLDLGSLTQESLDALRRKYEGT